MPKPHTAEFRVYYEDTDAGGVVYYANYLKFAERARTEMLRDMGISQSELSEKEGILFVVRNVEADIIKPARLDDLLSIETIIEDISGAKLKIKQTIKRNNNDLVSLKVLVVCIDNKFKPSKIPDSIKKRLRGEN